MTREQFLEFRDFLIKFTLENEGRISRNWLLAVIEFCAKEKEQQRDE